MRRGRGLRRIEKSGDIEKKSGSMISEKSGYIVIRKNLVTRLSEKSVNMVIRNVSQYGYQKYWVKWLSKILGRMVIKNIG